MKSKKIYTEYVEISQKFEQMLIYAERYACGREDYSVELVVDYIVALLPRLSDGTLRVFDEDMKIKDRLSLTSSLAWWGMECDYREWMRFWDAVKAEIIRRNVAGDGNSENAEW